MFEQAIKARLPLIRVRSNDPVNEAAVIGYLAGNKVTVKPYTPTATTNQIVVPPVSEDSITVITSLKGLDETALWKTATAKKGVILYIAREDDKSGTMLFFDAGRLPVPDALYQSLVKSVLTDPEAIRRVSEALRGLELKDAEIVLRLAASMYGSITAKTVLNVRAKVADGSTGLTQVPTQIGFYDPQTDVVDWVESNRAVFKQTKHPNLWPRGLLFTGGPGTGKTTAAKWVAKQFDVPLFRLDIAGMMGKWLGDSEKHLRAAFQQVEQCSPCVVLLDEVEKVFNQGASHETVSRMLSTLLWWLQERAHPFVVIMTTNNIASIPPELYRRGRLDGEVTFEALPKAEAVPFMMGVAETFKATGLKIPTAEELASSVSSGRSGATYSQAHLTNIVETMIKTINFPTTGATA